ncbi:GIY-YIG nuclease family protein [Longimicrobium sp.]|uniref:GIY-YIG nuclease family protein n=1 Tax=Longimicrobium sp. TaxID=2029185 RepID=UPI002E35BF5E|nr:GIY-YIG nuclease family protein [Longimicrobium sp.]HEX6040507.1 GIY-YIG nuclease family protein [Longimicrobium sp.]
MHCVYILASAKRVLYVGMTNDLRRRLYEHKTGAIPGFTARYNIDRLVHYECTSDPNAAIRREKQLKGWKRERKVELIAAGNPEWDDLSDQVGLLGRARRVC